MQITPEMVEAVAKAIYERRCSLTWGVKPPPWDSLPRSVQDVWREAARAGLEAVSALATTQAMRSEVTPEMIEHGACGLYGLVLRRKPTDADWKAIGPAMRQAWLNQARACLEAALGGEADASADR